MITCLSFKKFEKGALLGFADIELEINKVKIQVSGCTLCQKDGRKWLNFPSTEYVNKEGEKKYKPIVKIPDKKCYDAFVEGAKKAIDIYIDNNPEPQQNAYSNLGSQQKNINHSYGSISEKIEEQGGDDGLPF